MKYILLPFIPLSILTACAPMRPNITLFLKEDNSRLYNLHGDDCLQSGFLLYKQSEKLVTIYSNCDVHLERTLKPYELPQWGIHK